jgi:hypothetical protein
VSRQPGLPTVWRKSNERWVNIFDRRCFDGKAQAVDDDGKLFRLKQQAVLRGREIARKHKLEHFIHRKDGAITERNSYGGDPKRRRG